MQTVVAISWLKMHMQIAMHRLQIEGGSKSAVAAGIWLQYLIRVDVKAIVSTQVSHVATNRETCEMYNNVERIMETTL